MSIDDDDDKPRREINDWFVIGLAALLTLCGVGMFFFTFTVPKEKPQPPAAETMIGIGAGSTITQPTLPQPKQP
jgi:hypothetical protein